MTQSLERPDNDSENSGSGDIATGDDSSNRVINWILIGVAAVLVIGGQIYSLDKNYKWFTAMTKWLAQLL